MQFLFVLVVAIGLMGCGGSNSSTRTESVPSEKTGGGSTTIYAGGDVVINEVIVTDNGVYIYNPGTGEVTYVGGDYMYYPDNSSEGGSSGTGVANTMNQEECEANNFFWCTVSNVCIDNGGSGGTGSCSAK